MRWEIYKEKVPQASALEDPMFSFGIINLPTDFSFTKEDMTMKEFSFRRNSLSREEALMKEMAEKEAEAVYTEIQGRINQIIKEVSSGYYELSHVYRATG